MDTDDVEHLTINALGGIDTITINDLAATDVTNVAINLGVNGAGDGASDAITINGTVGNDVIGVSGSGGSVTITINGVYVITISNSEPANDSSSSTWSAVTTRSTAADWPIQAYSSPSTAARRRFSDRQPG